MMEEGPGAEATPKESSNYLGPDVGLSVQEKRECYNNPAWRIQVRKIERERDTQGHREIKQGKLRNSFKRILLKLQLHIRHFQTLFAMYIVQSNSAIVSA